jgi:hypothetical protein
LSSKNIIQKWQSMLAVSGHIECWTVMERSTWQLLTTNAALTCPLDEACDDPIFQRAYEWMRTAMTEAGLPAPASKLTPWWCWVRRESDHAKPFIEDVEQIDDPVVLQLSIPATAIALSCFDLWHFVLNRSYVYASEEDGADFDSALKVIEPNSDNAALLEERLQKSWLTIFQLDQSQVDMGPFLSRSIQGCFWVLKQSYVTAVLGREDLDSYE